MMIRSDGQIRRHAAPMDSLYTFIKYPKQNSPSKSRGRERRDSHIERQSCRERERDGGRMSDRGRSLGATEPLERRGRCERKRGERERANER